MASGLCAGAGDAVDLHLVAADGYDAWAAARSPDVRAWLAGNGFRPEPGRVFRAPASGDSPGFALAGMGEGRDPFAAALLASSLPPGVYRIASAPAGLDPALIAIAWSDGAYRFSRYRRERDLPAELDIAGLNDAEGVQRIAGAVDGLRDLVNTPARDLGPDALAAAAKDLARSHGAGALEVVGDGLRQGYPLIEAVGRAAAEAPRFVEFAWGREGAPRVAIVGKGVTFDTGGLNLKTGDGMAIMKKDMGGAAHALALARLVMEAGLDVRLIVAVPIVENAVGAGAFRPGDILPSRSGLSVEIDNTDAEGRLILADALTRVCEHSPEIVIDFATLTGAARVALGPDLAPYFTDDEALASAIEAAATAVRDPVWRLPLWRGYEAQLKSPVADLKNTGDGAMAGSITAALFLKRFVTAPSWVHLDVWAWRPARYGRPAGAAACGLRAVWAMLKARYGSNGAG